MVSVPGLGPHSCLEGAGIKSPSSNCRPSVLRPDVGPSGRVLTGRMLCHVALVCSLTAA